jgi:RNA polymerase sigma factor (sigma-70 family)
VTESSSSRVTAMANEDREASPRPDLTNQEQFMASWQLAEPQLRAFLRKVHAYAEHADDILQATWLTASEHAHQYAHRGSTTGWFFRICQSVARQATSQDRRLPPGPRAGEIAADNAYSETGEYRRVELEDARLALVDSLTPRRRAIVRARFVNGQSDREIAATLGCQTSTIRTTIHFVREWCRARDPAVQVEGHASRRAGTGPSLE